MRNYQNYMPSTGASHQTVTLYSPNQERRKTGKVGKVITSLALTAFGLDFIDDAGWLDEIF